MDIQEAIKLLTSDLQYRFDKQFIKDAKLRKLESALNCIVEYVNRSENQKHLHNEFMREFSSKEPTIYKHVSENIFSEQYKDVETIINESMTCQQKH